MTQPAAQLGRLVVCATPIGNLDDVTLRVLAALAQADVVACEDTRRTAHLLARHGISAPLVSYHEHNERPRARELCDRAAAGATVALVAGVVHACLAAGVPVEVLPGASAVMTALVASGLPAERFSFVGFLPRARAQRGELLAAATDTLVAFESPRRLPGTLAQLAEAEPQRRAAVCRELTKLHEEVRRASVAELAAHYGEHPPRGEIVLICAPAGGGGRGAGGGAGCTEERRRAASALRELVAAGARPRPAASALARLTGVPANVLYRELTGGGG